MERKRLMNHLLSIAAGTLRLNCILQSCTCSFSKQLRLSLDSNCSGLHRCIRTPNIVLRALREKLLRLGLVEDMRRQSNV